MLPPSRAAEGPTKPTNRPVDDSAQLRFRLLMRQVPAFPIVGSFAERLLAHDLPHLGAAQRREVIAFVAHRVDGLPSFTRFGVIVLGSVFRGLLAVPGGWVLARILMKLPLPLVAEYPRLVRSLAFAYIWEHWPATSPTGAAQIEATA